MQSTADRPVLLCFSAFVQTAPAPSGYEVFGLLTVGSWAEGCQLPCMVT